MLIKNHTPYIGKLKLCFEKYPHYTQGNNQLNKVHLNLGFTKLVSRILIDESFDEGFKVDPEKLKIIENYTGGEIRDFKVSPETPHPADKGRYDFTLQNAFVYNDQYIGCVKDAWWYVKNKFIVCEKYSHGVAVKLKNYELAYHLYTNKSHERLDNIEGVYGYSHRGGNTFKIGDKIFDENWIPEEEDMLKLEKYFAKHLKKFDEKYSEEMSMNEWCVRYIPFKLRGSKAIENWNDAYEAARNMSKYLS